MRRRDYILSLRPIEVLDEKCSACDKPKALMQDGGIYCTSCGTLSYVNTSIALNAIYTNDKPIKRLITAEDVIKNSWKLKS